MAKDEAPCETPFLSAGEEDGVVRRRIRRSSLCCRAMVLVNIRAYGSLCIVIIMYVIVFFLFRSLDMETQLCNCMVDSML